MRYSACCTVTLQLTSLPSQIHHLSTDFPTSLSSSFCNRPNRSSPRPIQDLSSSTSGSTPSCALSGFHTSKRTAQF